MKRSPDLTTAQPTDIWVLTLDEQVPPGYGMYVVNGVVLAFRPHKEAQHGSERTIDTDTETGSLVQ